MYDAADLKTRLHALKAAYTATRSTAMAAVTRWESCDAHRYDLRPYYFEVNGLRRGQPIPADSPLTVSFRCGFDAAGRLVIESYYVDGALVAEFFWRYTPNFAEGVIYYRERPTELVHMRFENGRPQTYRHYDTRRSGAYNWERYTYEFDRLACITRRSETSTSATEYDYLLTYTPDGTLERITHRPNPGAPRDATSLPLYQRREVPYHPPADGHEFGQDIVAAIMQALAAQDIREPVCAAVLNYTRGKAYCPPRLYILTERERQWRVTRGEAALEALWRPNRASAIDITVPDAACAMFDRLTHEDALALLDAVAYALTIADWTGVIPETYDFVAFALDFDSDSAIERIYASANAEKITLLQSGGWI